MTSRTVRRALISLALVPWVSAAPAVQRSDLPFVKSLSATCDIDLSQIRHDLLVHSISEIIDSDGVTLPPPVGIVYVGGHSEMQCTTGECIYSSDEDSPTSAARLQTLSDTPITKQRPACGFTSFAGRSAVVKYTRLIAPSSVNFPESQLSVNVRGTVVFLPEIHTNGLDSMHNDGCPYRVTWQSLDACDQVLVESLKLAASNELIQKEERLLPGNTKTKRDEAVDENIIIIESGVRDASTKRKQKDRHGEKGAGYADEGNDGGPDDEDPIDEEENGQELIPQTDRNYWSLTTILFMTSCLLIVAARLFYVRWRRLVKPYRKRLRFRVGEEALLRWASEDMIFDDEELDTMAIGNGSLTTSEELPLNPSPTKSFVIQYGSAQ